MRYFKKAFQSKRTDHFLLDKKNRIIYEITCGVRQVYTSR